MILPLVILFLAFGAATGANGIEGSIEAVEAFYTESEKITKDFIRDEQFTFSQLAEKARAVKDLKEVEWSEAPSERRAQRLRGVVEDYANKRISSILYTINGKAELEGKLHSLKGAILSRLDERLKSEVPVQKEPRPLPPDTRSPQEEVPPGEPSGLWDR